MSGLAVITGGQQGIGLGIAAALSAAGFRIVIIAEADPASDAVRAALAGLGPGARYLPHDLRDISAIAPLVATLREIGPLTTFVSNAGVPAPVRGDMLAITPQAFDHVMDVNLRGGFFLAQAVAAEMLAAPAPGYRSMIFVTSVSAAMASVERAEYCISKAAASMMAANFALRLGPQGIGVFELRPGVIETALTAGVSAAYTARIAKGLVPEGRWGQPEDIGQVVVPIALGQMAFCTGAVIAVDGGLSIPRL